MATGERRFSAKDREVHKVVRRLIVPGEYDAKLLSDRAEMRRADRPDAMPRISIAFEILETEGDSGRNVIVYHDLHTSLKPGKDGKIMADRGNGVVALAKAMGREALEAADFGMVTINNQACINYKEILQWVKNRHGELVRCRVKHEKQQDGDKANRIDYFEEKVGGDDEVSADAEEDDSVPSLSPVPDLEALEDEPEMEELQMASGAKKQAAKPAIIAKTATKSVRR